jgi:hypothetical protein
MSNKQEMKMDAREKLTSMIRNIVVNNDEAAAEQDFHDFLVLKSRDVTGFDTPEQIDFDNDDEVTA